MAVFVLFRRRIGVGLRLAPRHRRSGGRVFLGAASVRRQPGTGLGRRPRPTTAQTLEGHVRRADGRSSGRGRGTVLRHMRRGGVIVPPSTLRRPSRRPRPRRVRPRMQRCRWWQRWRWRSRRHWKNSDRRPNEGRWRHTAGHRRRRDATTAPPAATATAAATATTATATATNTTATATTTATAAATTTTATTARRNVRRRRPWRGLHAPAPLADDGSPGAVARVGTGCSGSTAVRRVSGGVRPGRHLRWRRLRLRHRHSGRGCPLQ